MLETLAHDLRFTLRLLRKSPTFTLVAVAVIAIGSGAVTTIFSAANAVILRPLPGVERPRRLVDIARVQGDGRGSLTPSYPFYEHVRDESHTLTGIAAWTMVPLTVSTGAEGTSAFANMVSGNYFDVLGVRPAIGRFFAGDERTVPGAHPVIVLSHGFWLRRFGADSAIVGRRIMVNGAPYTVIGVAPRGFTGVIPVIRTDAWVPLMMAPQLGREPNALTNAGSGWLMLVGRLKDGATIDASRADLVAVAKAHLAEEPEGIKVFTGIAMSRVTGFPADASGAIYGFVALLLAASALVLVIASVNVAGMLLARATARRREMAVRIALGAGRGRLVRQLLTESVVLFVAGAVGGVIIAVGGSQLFGRVQLPVEVPIGIELTPDFRVLAFALGSALVTGLVFGLAPALQATRNDPSVSLRSDTAGAGARRSRVRSVLVAGQMALSLLLLMAAGLFVRAFDRGQRVDPGFERAHVATAPVMVGTAGYSDARARLFNEALRSRLLAAPGVTAVSFTRWVPLTNERAETSIAVDGFTPPAGRSRDGTVDVDFAIVAPDLLDVLRIPLLRGRAFAATDDAAAPQVALVNETFVRRYLAGREPLGSTFKNDDATVTIVGVVRDAKYSSLDEDPRPFMYLALAQNWRSSTNVLVRTTGDAAALGPVIRDAVRAVDPLLPVPEVITMENATSVVLLPQRIAAAVTAVMGLLGLILAAVGLYGVVAYTAGLRTREIGVRLALGAPGGSVLRLIMRDGMRLAGIGMVVGLVMAVVLTRVMTRFLFGVSPLDPLVFVLIPLTLASVALLANFLPARRAAATDPVVALRAD